MRTATKASTAAVFLQRVTARASEVGVEPLCDPVFGVEMVGEKVDEGLELELDEDDEVWEEVFPAVPATVEVVLAVVEATVELVGLVAEVVVAGVLSAVVLAVAEGAVVTVTTGAESVPALVRWPIPQGIWAPPG